MSSATDAHTHHHACSCVQADVLADMYSLADRMQADWHFNGNSWQIPDEHFQALLLRAVSILLLNPWVDDDQIGRRCARCPHTLCCWNAMHFKRPGEHAED